MKSFNNYKLIHKILCFIFIGLIPSLSFGEGKIVEANTPTATSDNFELLDIMMSLKKLSRKSKLTAKL